MLLNRFLWRPLTWAVFRGPHLPQQNDYSAKMMAESEVKMLVSLIDPLFCNLELKPALSFINFAVMLICVR